MKNRKLFLFTLMISTSLFQSCAQTRLEVTPSPNVSLPTTTLISTPLSESTINSIFPLCYLEPEVAYLNSSIHVRAESLPANHPVVIYVGTQQVATSLTDINGSVNTNIVIPPNGTLGLNQVSVYAEGTAIAADCVLQILPEEIFSPTLPPSLTPTILSTPSLDLRDFVTIRESYIGLHDQKEHLIFHVITKSASFIPKSIQILDLDTGKVTDTFVLLLSPAPNLCTVQGIEGWSYYATDKVFFEELPQNYESRLMGTSFTYLVEVEQLTGERMSIAITDLPGDCTNLVQ